MAAIEECASELTATRHRRPAGSSRPALGPPVGRPALGHLTGDDQRRQVGGRSAGDEAAARGRRQPGPVGDQAQHLVLRVDRARGLQPGDALDRRAGDQHVEQQRRLGRRGRDEAEEAGAVRRDHRGSQARGVHAEHLVRVVRQVAQQAAQRGVERGRVARALVQRDRVQPQPVLRVREYRPDHLLCGGIDAVHGRNVAQRRAAARRTRWPRTPWRASAACRGSCVAYAGRVITLYQDSRSADRRPG